MGRYVRLAWYQSDKSSGGSPDAHVPLADSEETEALALSDPEVVPGADCVCKRCLTNAGVQSSTLWPTPIAEQRTVHAELLDAARTQRAEVLANAAAADRASTANESKVIDG